MKHSPATCGALLDGGALCDTTPLPGPQHQGRCFRHSPAKCGASLDGGALCDTTPQPGSKHQGRCILHSPKIQAEIQVLMENSADYGVNRKTLLSFVDKWACEGSLCYIFFAGYGRFDDERSSNMEKLGKIVREQGKHVADFEEHELTVSFSQELAAECSYPPEYNKDKGETFSEKLGPCARKSALTLEQEMVGNIKCNNKVGGGGGCPPKHRWGCSIATTSVIILVPASNVTNGSSASRRAACVENC